MAINVRITNILRRGARATLVRWRGGSGANLEKGEIEIPGGMPEFRAWIREQRRESREDLVKLALIQWLVTHPTENADFTAIEGKQLTLDFTQPTNVGVFQVGP